MGDSLKAFHLSDVLGLVPEALAPILITLSLSFLIGLEREEHADKRFYNFGGVRTFPIIGLCGYLMARLTEGQPLFLGFGVLVFGALLSLSYRKKLELSATSGMTSEVSGLFTFLMGALIFRGALWEATTLAVVVLLLLELKSWLEALARKLSPEEIFTFTRFLLISAVILPIVPNRDFTDIHLNPFRTWLVVVAISGLSYAAYVIERALGSKRSILLAAILGGIYSSTSTTVVLAKRSREGEPSNLYPGAIVIASGFMYFRLSALLCVFNWDLGSQLLLPFICLGIIFSAVGASWMFIGKQIENPSVPPGSFQGRNPLELQSAFVFAILFSVMGVFSVMAIQHFGTLGIYSLSFISGLADVDPFVMSLTQSSGGIVSQQTAARAIIIAAASNNVVKGAYAAIWGAGDVRKRGSIALVGLALVSLLALIFS